MGDRTKSVRDSFLACDVRVEDGDAIWVGPQIRLLLLAGSLSWRATGLGCCMLISSMAGILHKGLRGELGGDSPRRGAPHANG